MTRPLNVTKPPSQIASALKGRGTVWALQHRFAKDVREDIDDDWGSLEQRAQEEHLPPATHVIEEQAKTILSANESPDIHFDLSINPYRGCEHGCVYCFARPTHSYLNLSPGLDFETRIIAKVNAAERLRHAGVTFIIEPHLRFVGMPGEQWTMFFKDPSGNNLEFKAMTKIENLFAKYNVVDK